MLAVGLADSVDVADTVGDGDGDLRAAVFEACEPHALIRTRRTSAETPRALFTTVRIVGHYRPPPRPCPRGKSRDPDDIGSPARGEWGKGLFRLGPEHCLGVGDAFDLGDGSSDGIDLPQLA